MKKLVSVLLIIAVLASLGSISAQSYSGDFTIWRSTIKAQPVIRNSITSYPFYYSQDYPSQQLAETCALYSMLAYRDSKYVSLNSTKTVPVANRYGLDKQYINGYWIKTEGKSAAAKQALIDTLLKDGFTDIRSYRYDYSTGPDKDTNIPSMTSRKLSDRNYSPFILAHRVVRTGNQAVLASMEYDETSSSYHTVQDQILILFCGTTEAEWYGDFEVTGRTYDETKDYHVSFQNAVDDAVKSLADYITYLRTGGALKTEDFSFLLTGHSRGAAVANMMAHQLTDLRDGNESRYSSDKKMKSLITALTDSGRNTASVYAYTFATPNVATSDKIQRDGYYSNIFNYCFYDDFVPNLPLVSWGWDKYGRSYWTYASELLGYGTVTVKKTDRYGQHTEYYYYSFPNAFGLDTELYFNRAPSYNPKYTAKIVETTEKMTDHSGRSGVGNYYNYRYRDRNGNLLPSLYSFMHTYLATLLYKIGNLKLPDFSFAPKKLAQFITGILVKLAIDEIPAYEVSQMAAFAVDSCREYKTLSQTFIEGAAKGVLADTHMPISYYSGMVNCFDSFLLAGNNRSAELKSEDAAELAGEWDPELETDPGDLAALKELLSRPAAVQDGEESCTVAEMLDWDIEDPSTWDGAEWDAWDGVQHLWGLDISFAGLAGTFDVSAFPYLYNLDVSHNALTELKLSGENLSISELNCSGNALTELDCSGRWLFSLDCSDNALTSLTGISSVSQLDCSGNRLTVLPWDELTGLWELDCSGNLMDPRGQELTALYDQMTASYGRAVILPQNMPEDAVFDENDLACLEALASQGGNAALLGWDLTKPASLEGVEWTRSGDAWYLSKLSLEGLGLTGSIDLSGCPLLSSVDVSGNGFTSVTVSECPSLTLLNVENNVLAPEALDSLDALGEVVTVTGGQKYIPDGMTLSPEDVSALLELSDRYSLDWSEDTLFTIENLLWETEDGGLLRLAGIDLSGTCAWGELDLTCFTALKTFMAQGTQLESLTLPPTVEEIPENAFAVSLGLNTVYITGKAPAVSEYTFGGCSPELEVRLAFDSELPVLSVGDSAAPGTSNFSEDAALTWYASDESVATVDSSGNVSAVGPGAAELAAVSDDGFTALATVYVRGLSIRTDHVGPEGASVTLFAADTDVGTVRLLLAAYDAEGRMLGCAACQGEPGTDGLPLTLAADNAAVFRAFVLSDTGVPLLKLWERAV